MTPSMGKRFLINAGVVPTSRREKQYLRETRNFYGNCHSTANVYLYFLLEEYKITVSIIKLHTSPKEGSYFFTCTH